MRGTRACRSDRDGAMRDKQGSLGRGGGLILVGVYLLARAVGAVWFGVAALLSAAVFLYITIASGEWSDMVTLWPVILVVVGLGYIVVSGTETLTC